MARSILASFNNVETKRRELNTKDIDYIYYKDITPAKINRKLRNIDELAEDILEDGLEENLVVREIDSQLHKYEIIAGHHRYSAICSLIKKNHSEFEYIPCKVIKNLSDLEAKRRQHLNNIFQRGYTQTEMIDVIEELQEIYKVKKKEENLPGRVQTLVAEAVGLHKTQIGNYQYIINNATPEVRQIIREKELPITTAIQLCTLDHEEQLMFIENEATIDLMTIREYKDEQEKDKKDVQENVPVTGTNDNKDSYEIYEYEQENEEEKIKESEKKFTLEELANNAKTSIQDMLKIMRKYTEWNREEEELEEIYRQLQEFLIEAGIN